MFAYTLAFDTGALKTSPIEQSLYTTPDFTFILPSGLALTGPAAWSAILTMYSPFTAHSHEPFHYCVVPTETGYDLLGQAMMYANLPVPGGGDKKKDLQGREWDLGVPGSFHFSFVKSEDGVKGWKLAREALFADGLSMVKPMVERGMVNAEMAVKGPGGD